MSESISSRPAADPSRRTSLGTLLRLLARPDVGPVLAMLLVAFFFWAIDSGGVFASPTNVRLMLANAARIAVPALGMTVIIIAGGIDLSSGTALALCSSVLAKMLELEFGWPVAVTACLLTGLGCGLLNGGIISLTGIVPFVVTLGTMSIFLGLANLVTNETSLEPPRSSIPWWLNDLAAARGSSLGFEGKPWFPLGLAVEGLAALLLGIVLYATVFGRRIFAIGSNERTARLCGIPVGLTKTAVYTIGGLFVALGALYQFSFIKQASARDGIGLELQFIAAVVIGGGSLNGGRGSIIGTLAGAMLAAIIESGVVQLGLKSPAKSIVLGAVIIAAVGVDRFRNDPPDWLRRLIRR